MDDQEQAIAELRALLQVPGALRIITNELHDEFKDADLTREQAEALPLAERQRWHQTGPRAGVSLTSAGVYIQHDVVAIEGPDDRGRYQALSAEGARTIGYPVDLLNRLRQWRT